MKQDIFRIPRLVGMVLIPEFPAIVIRVEQLLKLLPQQFQLRLRKDLDSADVPIFVKKFQLLAAQELPGLDQSSCRFRKTLADGLMKRGKIDCHEDDPMTINAYLANT